ncbi:EAL and HDOD domain-containing protein [Burkholderia sp. Ac-20379]|uniref:EAL and HDOD domain-containing protein n=1 Tax=Burkholderia sp. Ac-20379 TaxID=2703900 RepID=UPI00197F0F23|nr:EAL domain-containing protein [Burkholderia sp. Ac-20379]MBN3724881.1 EAL domain-containing protein [Burkholderia sp. Ac-20379]
MKNITIARQPITDRKGSLYGHELLYRGNAASVNQQFDGMRTTLCVIEASLGVIGLQAVSRQGSYFLNCTTEFLKSPIVDILPSDRFVLELLETCELNSLLFARCEALKAKGFRLALDDVRCRTAAIDEFLPVIDVVKVDWPHVGAEKRCELIEHFKERGKVILAEKIETREDYGEAMRLGCDLFQGYYFCMPEVLSSSAPRTDLAVVLDVIRKATSGADMREIQRSIERAPALCVQILKFANAANVGRLNDRQYTSTLHALAILGSRRIVHWCVVALYGGASTVGLDPLVDLACQRATLAEEYLRRISRCENEVQSGRLVGLLSLVHVRYGLEKKAFWDSVPVTESVKSAILDARGRLGDALNYALSFEVGSRDHIAPL